jgi:hypothetical protein
LEKINFLKICFFRIIFLPTLPMDYDIVNTGQPTVTKHVPNSSLVCISQRWATELKGTQRGWESSEHFSQTLSIGV